ncbi:MAG: NTP transferase domain-containing protein [Nitrospinales bacterium]
MNAILLAAGVGRRLGAGEPKCLLPFAGQTLLARHLEILRACGIDHVTVGVGYQADQVRAAIADLDADSFVTTALNPDYEQGSILTLHALREPLTGGGDVLLMDADVLYDRRLLRRLLDSSHPDCCLLDRNFEPGDEPVKLCVRDGALVEFRKKANVPCDFCGESVGFFKLAETTAQKLAAATQRYVDDGKTGECYEEALRDVLLASRTFGFEDITGLPWTEIDFPEDVERARRDILPRLMDE